MKAIPAEGEAPLAAGSQRASPVRRRPEDTAAGCRTMADDDRARAAAMGSDRMRFRLERSADAWTARADLLQRLERSFNARATAKLAEQSQPSFGRKADG